MMNEEKIKQIKEAITDTIKKSGEVPQKISKKEVDFEKLMTFLQYEQIRVNLELQKDVLITLDSTDKLTKLAYRVALISLGASLISIVATLIR